MATEEDNVELEESEDKNDSKGKKVAKHDAGAADLEKVTDYVEEAEISTQHFSNAMKVVNDRKTKEASERQEREREMSKVKINKEDVDLIVCELEVTKMLAERVLREHKGNVVEALVSLTN